MPKRLSKKAMPAQTINSRDQFERWVANNWDFHDARVLLLSPVPKSAAQGLPSQVIMELGYQIEGNYKAHSMRVSRVFRLQATCIAEYRFSTDGTVSPEHLSEGIEILESESPIAFRIDVPAMLTLHCSKISVEELPNLIETVAPWLSKEEVFAKAPDELMPSPAQWQSKFHDLGQDVIWHIYHGSARETNEVPSLNYEGWFLQTHKDLDECHQGIFFFSCEPDGGGFRLHIQNRGASDALWQTAMTILAAFDRVEIHCGNCELSGPEFLREWNTCHKAQQGAGGNALSDARRG